MATLDQQSKKKTAAKGKTSTSRGGASPDQIAELVLALPKGKGSKLREVERAVVIHALDACDGNVSAAARLIGVDRKAMERRVAKARTGSKRKSR
jgi:DNA-binding NtrC family response regulator